MNTPTLGACAIVLFGCASSPDTPAVGAAGTSSAGGSASGGSAGASSAGTASAGLAGSSASGGVAAAAGTSGNAVTGGTPSAAGTSTMGASGMGGLAAAGAGPSGQAGATSVPGCPKGAVFCDDFETFAADAPPTGNWAARTNGMATVLVDTVHAHSGTKAVHFHSASVDNNQRAYILTDKAPGFPVTTDTLYVRFMFYIGRYMTLDTSVHNRIAWVGSKSQLASGGGNGPGYIFATYNGIAIERLETNHGFQRDTSQHMEDASRANKWQCFEFEIDNKGGVPPGEKSDSTTRPHIWQEGVELKLGAGGTSDSWLAAPFEALQFSLWCPQTDTKGADYWIDDVVVSTERINCPAP